MFRFNTRQQRQSPAIAMPYMIRNLRRIKLNSKGCDEQGRFYPKGKPVFEYDLVFAGSYRTFDTDYVRAKNEGVARVMIQVKHANAERFEF